MSDASIVHVNDLAICGALPAFAEPRHVGRPNLGDVDGTVARLREVLESRWLTNNGPRVRELESEIAAMSGYEHCVAVCNATIGLQLGASALGMSGEVLMPSFTFVGTAHAVRFIGASPVFCEIDPSTHTLDPSAVAAAISPETTGIIGVHLWGRSGHAATLADLAATHGLPLMFDAAHALGCTTGLGQLEVISLHATKIASSGEGGAILTNDSDLADRLRLMRNFGFTDYDTVAALGTNAKLSEISAAIGLGTLKALPDFIAVNRRNYECYQRGLSGVDGLSLIEYAEHHNYHYIVIEVPSDVRDDLITVLSAENVFARRYFHPGCHRHIPYRDHAASLPVTEELAARVITLPTGTAMNSNDVRRVCALVQSTIAQAPTIRERIAEMRPAVSENL